MAQGKAKSPYQRHRKAKYQHSAEYQRWFAAAKRNDQAEMTSADASWQRKFGRHAASVVVELGSVPAFGAVGTGRRPDRTAPYHQRHRRAA